MSCFKVWYSEFRARFRIWKEKKNRKLGMDAKNAELLGVISYFVKSPRKLDKTKQMVVVVLVGMSALPGCTAFSKTLTSQGLTLRTPGAFCSKGPEPRTYSKRRVSREGIAGLKMELLGKRYWMWNASEWLFDKFVELVQLVSLLLYRFISPFFESGPYDPARLKPIHRRLAEIRAKTTGQKGGELDMMDVVWEVGAADEKFISPDSQDTFADSHDTTLVQKKSSRYVFNFSILAIPALIQAVSFVSGDMYLKAVGSASVWLVVLAVFVDWVKDALFGWDGMEGDAEQQRDGEYN